MEKAAILQDACDYANGHLLDGVNPLGLAGALVVTAALLMDRQTRGYPGDRKVVLDATIELLRKTFDVGTTAHLDS